MNITIEKKPITCMDHYNRIRSVIRNKHNKSQHFKAINKMIDNFIERWGDNHNLCDDLIGEIKNLKSKTIHGY